MAGRGRGCAGRSLWWWDLPQSGVEARHRAERCVPGRRGCGSFGSMWESPDTQPRGRLYSFCHLRCVHNYASP